MNRQRVADIVMAVRHYEGSIDELETSRDVQCHFDVTEQEAVDILSLVNGPSVYSGLQELSKDQKVQFVDHIFEGFHSSMDGWDYDDEIVIELFVKDILLGMSA